MCIGPVKNLLQATENLMSFAKSIDLKGNREGVWFQVQAYKIAEVCNLVLNLKYGKLFLEKKMVVMQDCDNRLPYLELALTHVAGGVGTLNQHTLKAGVLCLGVP